MPQEIDNQTTRLGELLLGSKQLTEKQLSLALTYQSQHQVKLGTALKRLKFVSSGQIRSTLYRQRMLRWLAGGLALTCGPINLAIAEPHLSVANYLSVPDTSSTSQPYALTSQSQYTTELRFTEKPIDEGSRDFYFTGEQQHLFSLNSDFTDHVSVKFSLFSSQQSATSDQIKYQFEPQVSLYSSASTTFKTQFDTSRIGPGLDRATNTIPAVFMLTLKGRCLYENSGTQTTMWSLDSAKKGVQRKAVLMFSITKHF